MVHRPAVFGYRCILPLTHSKASCCLRYNLWTIRKRDQEDAVPWNLTQLFVDYRSPSVHRSPSNHQGLSHWQGRNESCKTHNKCVNGKSHVQCSCTQWRNQTSGTTSARLRHLIALSEFGYSWPARSSTCHSDSCAMIPCLDLVLSSVMFCFRSVKGRDGCVSSGDGLVTQAQLLS